MALYLPIKIMISYLNLFGKQIPMFGVCCFLGIILACIIGFLLAKKSKYEFYDFALIVVITLVCGYIGAKLLFFIVSFNDVLEIFKNYPFMIAFQTVMQGGFVFYGGFIGGVFGLFVTLKVMKKSFIEYGSIFAVGLTLAHSFGRIGCFFSGCCYGIEYDGFLSISYKTAIDAFTPLNTKLLPVQLIESALLFILFGVLLFIYLKKDKPSKLVITIYLICYPAIRFIIEFFRGDIERGTLGIFSTSQWISIIIIVVFTCVLVIDLVKKKKSNKKSE